MPLSAASTKSRIGLFIISATAQRKWKVQQRPKGGCLTRSLSSYATLRRQLRHLPVNVRARRTITLKWTKGERCVREWEEIVG
ncbi:hypothetical protein ANCDUO_02959 [Ancylostoma duodenale]|uniref:Uncharacterized protein n=1 Tax=Ancylostoma duodenale TaxID=51022 RepID=A0A0C2DAH3_9BILA|nr:hypothetical protein ANCDUO_02959 [Ancylostoma duodenale]